MFVNSTAKATAELSGTTNLSSLLLRHLGGKNSDFNEEKQVIGLLIRERKNTDRFCRKVESTSNWDLKIAQIHYLKG